MYFVAKIKMETFLCVYHDDEDSLFLRPEPPVPATSVDWNGEFWVRIKPGTGEIVGIEIENFESVFIKKYPAMALIWKQVKPSCKKKCPNKPEGSDWDAFMRIILEVLSLPLLSL